MTIQEILEEKRISIYRLAKISGLPYATVNDICKERAQIEKCSAETVYRLAMALEVTMEELVSPAIAMESGIEKSVNRAQLYLREIEQLAASDEKEASL